MVNRFGMTFGEALEEMNCHAKVRRKGWNGKNMHIAMMPGYMDGIPANKAAAEKMGVKEGEIIKVHPYIMMKDALGHMVPGWLASQTDMLAEDWEIVKDNEGKE